VIFLYLLLPNYGMQGYFVSFALTHLLNFGLSLRRLLRITGEQLPFSAPALTLAAMLCAIWAGSRFPSPTLSLTVYLAVLFSTWTLLGIVGKNDLRWMKNLLKPV